MRRRRAAVAVARAAARRRRLAAALPPFPAARFLAGAARVRRVFPGRMGGGPAGRATLCKPLGASTRTHPVAPAARPMLAAARAALMLKLPARML